MLIWKKVFTVIAQSVKVKDSDEKHNIWFLFYITAY